MTRLAILFMFCTACFTVLAQKKIKVVAAMVDMDTVMAHMPEIKDALMQLDTAAARVQKQMDIMLIQLSAALYPPDSARKKSDLEYKRDVEALQKRLLEFQKQSREEMEKKRIALYTDIHKKAKKVCIKFAKKNGFKVLLEKKKRERAIILNELEIVDITWRIVEQLKNTPTKKR